MPRIVCVSDTHLVHVRTEYPVPEGDILLHAGDATRRGTPEEIRLFSDWFAAQPHAHKVFVAGNHDFDFENHPAEARAALDPSIVYLQDEVAEIAGLQIWGSPWQPRFFNWAFNLDRGAPLRAVWQKIPIGVDVLITHGPPKGIGDRTLAGISAGCADLLDEITTRIHPRLHLFGHIHEGYGVTLRDGTRFVNASSCDIRYRLVNPPIVVDL